jgi:hypothetical protein
MAEDEDQPRGGDLFDKSGGKGEIKVLLRSFQVATSKLLFVFDPKLRERRNV